MPTIAEIRERAEQVTTRLHALTNQSMQQVRLQMSRSADYVQHRFITFNNTCRGRKDENGTQNSQQNGCHRDSSKDQMKQD